jgi:hypothetical protein
MGMNALSRFFGAGVRVGLLALVSLASAPLSCWAADATSSAFTVANYPVEARAKDSVTAKNTALADGQQAALRSLFRRIVPVTAYRRLKTMPAVKASDIIDGVSVREERTSTTDYIATLDFSFQPEAVRGVLRRNSIPFVDTQAPQTLLVPLYRAKPDAPYESGRGVWFDSWKGLDLVHTLSPLKLEKLAPEITPETIAAIVKGTPGADRTLATSYKSERVILAISEPDATGKRLNVTLTGTDAVGTFTLQRMYRVTGNDLAYSSELAAVVALGVFEGRWKAGKAGAVGGLDVAAGENVQVVVEFATLSEWNDIRTRILDTTGALDVAIGSVSAHSAEVALRHEGGAPGLTEAFALKGLTMSNSEGTWLVRSTF